MSLPVTDPVLIVAIAMAAFLLMPLVTERLRLPDIIGILLAGVLVGPHGVGLLARNETIHLLGTVGLLYLVFLAGLEVDLADLNRKRRRAIAFGVITFLVPQVVGTVSAILLFGLSMAPAILIGSVFSSHSFLALLIAKRMGLTDRELVIAVIGGTVITDTLALLVLAVVAQSTAGDSGPWFLLRLLVQTALFATAVVFGLPLLGRWFFRRVTDGGAHFTFMLTVLFTCGYVAHLAGLEPIIGAFLAGLAMNRLVPHHGVLANRAFFVGNTIFVPFFLLSVGMLIDLRMVLSDLRTIQMAIFMTITVIVCKGGAAWLMRPLFGYGRDDAMVAWGLSLPQAATTLAVVLVGHDLDLFDDAILNATIVMVLVTCVLGPLLVQVAGRRLASAAPHHQPSESEAKLQRILIPLANPRSSERLLDLAIALRRPLVDEPLLPLSVARNGDQVAASEDLLATSVLHIAAADVPVTPLIRVDLNPVGGILRAMAELRATTILVGWSGPHSNWQRHFHLARGVIDELVEGTTTQLLIVRLCEPPAVIERVFLAIPANAASEFGFAELVGDCKLLTKRIGAQLVVTGEAIASEELQREITRTGVTCPVSFTPSPGDVQQLVETLATQLRIHDLMIIVGCRAGTVSWDSAWNRLPTRLAHRAGSVSLAVAYPRIEGLPFARPTVTHHRGSGLLPRAVMRLREEAADLPSLITSTLDALAIPATTANGLVRQLSGSISALDGHVALAHAHTARVDAPRFAVVVTATTLEHEGLQLRVLLLLLNPLGFPAERHLAHLAAIAALVHDTGRIEALLAAEDVEQAQRILD